MKTFRETKCDDNSLKYLICCLRKHPSFDHQFKFDCLLRELFREAERKDVFLAIHLCPSAACLCHQFLMFSLPHQI